MTDTGYFKSGNNLLFYSSAIPQSQKRKQGIIFVHAADGNRLGPHRMFVELAEKFNSLGYPTFRFDLTGCGDSTGSTQHNNIENDILDVIQAVNFFRTRADLESIILLGISRGARVCFNALSKYALPLNAAILLSAPASTGKTAIKSFGAGLKEYFCKLKDPQSLRKLLSAKVNVAQICKTLLAALLLSRRYPSAQNTTIASKCPLLFIYGECDPITADSSLYYAAKCRENRLPHYCHIIHDANHSFFHYEWKEEIFKISSHWLENILHQSK